MGKAALVYGAGRLGLFVLAALLVWTGGQAVGADVNGLPLLLSALVLSSLASVWVLGRQRVALAEQLQARRDAKTAEIAERRARLDREP